MSLNWGSYEPGDENGILDLMMSSYGSRRSSEHWNWKYKNNYTGKILIELAKDKEQSSSLVVGQYALMPLYLNYFGRKILSAQSLDTLTHPEYRGQGIFVKLASRLFDRSSKTGYELLYGFPNDQSYHGFVKKLGWDHIGDINFQARPLSLKISFAKKFPKSSHILKYTGLFPIADFFYFLIYPIKKPKNLKVQEIQKFDDNYQKFYNKMTKGNSCIGVYKSKEYMNWRYTQSKAYQYKCFVKLDSSKQWLGYVIVSMQADKGALVDWLAINNTSESELLGFAQFWFKSQGANYIKTWTIPGASSEATLKKLGFLKSLKVPMIVKPLKEGFEKSKLIHNWLIRPGDCDTF